MKFPCINVTKYIQNIHEENCKTLMKVIKQLIKWKGIPCSCVERLKIVVSILSNLIYKFNTILIKIKLFCRYIEKQKVLLIFSQRS